MIIIHCIFFRNKLNFVNLKKIKEFSSVKHHNSVLNNRVVKYDLC